MGNRVLLVDDQLGVRRLLQEIFVAEGYSVSTAANGIDALDKVREAEFDLALVDMKMPGMGGLELLRHLKARFPGMVVIIMTAYGELKVVNEALALGAYKCITKPFDIDELVKTVRTAFLRKVEAG